jgi:hypothetical protein
VSEIIYSSFLENSLFSELESIFFFNPRQKTYLPEIQETVLLFGEPKINKASNGLSVVLSKVPDAQCLFATESDKKLLAVAIFTRNENEELEILHIAICPNWQNPIANGDGLEKIITQLYLIAKRIRGVNKLRLPYGRGIIKIRK